MRNNYCYGYDFLYYSLETLHLIMDLISLKKPFSIQPAAGTILIAEPMLNDPNFVRSVVLLCEHGDEGSVGFVLNNPMGLTLEDLLPEIALNTDLKIFQGGPVQVDTLHMVHRMHDILGGKEIAPGIYWGGSYEALQDAIADHTCRAQDLRLFVGYSGWSPGQLDEELKQGSWIVADLSEEVLFAADPEMAWKQAVRLLGKDYAYLENMPIDPTLN
jgi:putative transcriptional regulator